MGNERVMPRWAAVLAAVVAVLAVVACSGDDGGEDEASADTTEAVEPVDTTPAESTTTTLSPEAEVEAAIADYYAMVGRLVQAPDPADPELTQRATGANRDGLVAMLTEYVALGQSGQPGPSTSQTVLGTEVSGDQATAEVCAVDSGLLVDTATGRVIDNDVITDRILFTLVRVDGSWLVSKGASLGSWEGVSDCA